MIHSFQLQFQKVPNTAVQPQFEFAVPNAPTEEHQSLVELNLLQYHLDIRSSIAGSNPDVNHCISVLGKCLSLEVNASMLQKNIQAVKFMKRLRNYYGNVVEWNYTEEQRLAFNAQAARIRQLAEINYKRFKLCIGNN